MNPILVRAEWQRARQALGAAEVLRETGYLADALSRAYYATLHAAKAEGISMNQFLVIAAAEKMAALLTEDYLAKEARQGQRADFEKVLQAVPHVEPEEYDRL